MGHNSAHSGSVHSELSNYQYATFRINVRIILVNISFSYQMMVFKAVRTILNCGKLLPALTLSGVLGDPLWGQMTECKFIIPQSCFNRPECIAMCSLRIPS